jgi:hypothetical protein
MYISCFIKQHERVHCGVWAYSVREGVGPKKLACGRTHGCQKQWQRVQNDRGFYGVVVRLGHWTEKDNWLLTLLPTMQIEATWAWQYEQGKNDIRPWIHSHVTKTQRSRDDLKDRIGALAIERCTGHFALFLPTLSVKKTCHFSIQNLRKK